MRFSKLLIIKKMQKLASQKVELRFQGALAGNVHKHFQKSALEYAEEQMLQTFPEPGEKYGLTPIGRTHR